MNGEVPSVPITTLAGVSSLSDLLPEMPLPTPLPHTLNNKSLLFHPKIVEDSRRILASRDPNLVSQLVNALRKTNTDHIELNDGSSSEAIDGEMPELLKAIIAQDSTVFKGGAVFNRVDSGGVPNPQPQQPSPYQAGQSPCTPGSPARVPQMHNQGFNGPSGSKFHQPFMNFAPQVPSDPPAVNGGSPGMHCATTSMNKVKAKSAQRSSTVSSPAQAALAPDESSQHSLGNDMPTAPELKNASKVRTSSTRRKLIENVEEHNTATKKEIKRVKFNVAEKENVALPEDMSKHDEEGMKLKTPTLSLTRIEESLKKDRKKSYYNVVSSTPSGSETKLKLKISKIHTEEDSKGVKRNIIDLDSDDEYTPSKNLTQSKRTGTPIKDMEIHEEFSVSLGDRVAKRRRRAVRYDISSESEDEDSSSRKKKKVPTATLR